MSETAYLILEDGTVFEGYSFGATGEVIGEIVFTTAMTGYLETLTDKSYYGQIITQTFPLIGNYGVITSDLESPAVSARGYIVKSWCQDPSNFRSEENLDTFLKAQNIIGLYGIDTRQLTKIIREKGVMNGKITRSNAVNLVEIKEYRIAEAVANVSARERYDVHEHGTYKIALWDFGLKENMIRELVKRDCALAVFPHDTDIQDILAYAPDGIMLSNGPGNPAENKEVILGLQKLMNSHIPMFGICLGHQLLALANGFATAKIKYGHRGANQPAKDLLTGRTYITSQNHGYAVCSESIDPAKATLWFENVNDKTCEGIKYKNKPVFSVQFHPEACGGPQDTAFLFDEFMSEVKCYAKR